MISPAASRRPHRTGSLWSSTQRKSPSHSCVDSLPGQDPQDILPTPKQSLLGKTRSVDSDEEEMSLEEGGDPSCEEVAGEDETALLLELSKEFDIPLEDLLEEGSDAPLRRSAEGSLKKDEGDQEMGRSEIEAPREETPRIQMLLDYRSEQDKSRIEKLIDAHAHAPPPGSSTENAAQSLSPQSVFQGSNRLQQVAQELLELTATLAPLSDTSPTMRSSSGPPAPSSRRLMLSSLMKQWQQTICQWRSQFRLHTGASDAPGTKLMKKHIPSWLMAFKQARKAYRLEARPTL